MINPSEISDILKQQLVEDIAKRQAAFEEEGTVLEVGDGVAHAYGLHNVEANELVQFENGVTGVAMNLEESDVGIILLDEVDSVTENMKVRRTGEIASIEVGEGLLGRVINVLAKPIDGKGSIEGKKTASAARAQGSWRYLPPAREPAAADRPQGHRLDDPHRPRTARTYHR